MIAIEDVSLAVTNYTCVYLSCYNSRSKSSQLCILIKKPGHNPSIRVHVWCWNVFIRSNDFFNSLHVETQTINHATKSLILPFCNPLHAVPCRDCAVYTKGVALSVHLEILSGKVPGQVSESVFLALWDSVLMGRPQCPLSPHQKVGPLPQFSMSSDWPNCNDRGFPIRNRALRSTKSLWLWEILPL